MLKIICIEEHANDPGIGQAAVPAMMREAPYMALCQSERVASVPHDPNRPGQVAMAHVLPLASEIGAVRLKANFANLNRVSAGIQPGVSLGRQGPSH